MSQIEVRLTVESSVEDLLGEILIDQFPCVLGRHPECDYQVNLPFISRHHCSLFLHEGRVWVQDLNSRNRTSVNGREALRSQQLHDGDQLHLGSLALHVAVAQPAAEPESGLLVGGKTYTS